MTTMTEVAETLNGLVSDLRAIGITRCRVISRNRIQCTGEALSADADIQICARHAGEVMRLVNGR